MSEKPAKPADVVKLDTETILQTTDGRKFLNQINSVSRVLAMKDSQVEFKGEEVVKTGYAGDYKSAQLFKCPDGYLLFCSKTLGKNHWSIVGTSLDEVLAQVSDAEVKKKITEETSGTT